MLTAAALAFVINIAGAGLNWSLQRLGRVWTQAILFVVALIAAAYWQYHGLLPGLAPLVAGALTLFSLAVAFYEVLLSRFAFFSGPKA